MKDRLIHYLLERIAGAFVRSGCIIEAVRILIHASLFVILLG